MELKITDDQKYYNQCLEIRKEVFVEEQNVPLEMEVDEYEKESVNILLTLDDRPIGTVRYRDIGDGLIKVERMAVREIARGLHLGQALMNFVHIHAEENGFTRIHCRALDWMSTTTRSEVGAISLCEWALCHCQW